MYTFPSKYMYFLNELKTYHIKNREHKCFCGFFSYSLNLTFFSLFQGISQIFRFFIASFYVKYNGILQWNIVYSDNNTTVFF